MIEYLRESFIKLHQRVSMRRVRCDNGNVEGRVTRQATVTAFDCRRIRRYNILYHKRTDFFVAQQRVFVKDSADRATNTITTQ